MGQALMDYHKGFKGGELIVSTNISEEESYPVSYFFRKYDEMPLLEKMALDLAKGEILDVGAGTGIHALELQERGESVKAIEISDLCVAIMKDKQVKNAEKVDFFKLKANTYDTILFLMNGIGLVKTMDGFEEFFKQCSALLKPNGQILFDSSDLLYLYEDEDGSYLINLNDKYYGEVLFQTEYNGEKGVEFPWLFIDFDNLKQQAEKFGFSAELIENGAHFDYLARLTESPE